MELKTYFAQDRAGNLVPNATVTIYLTGTNTLATGLKTVNDAALSNPFTASADGKIQFKAADGIYDMQISYSTQIGPRITIQCLDQAGQVAAAQQAASDAQAMRDQTQQIIDDAGEQSTLVALAQPDGTKRIGRCSDVANLRTIEPTVPGQIIELVSHSAGWAAMPGTPKGGGEFYYDATDTATADDNGTVIVTAGGARWKRLKILPLRVDYFGLTDGGDLDVPLSNAINAAKRLNINELIIPTNTTYYNFVGGLSFEMPSTDLAIKGDGDGYFGCLINHTGNNVGITFTRPSSVSMFKRVSIRNVRVKGNLGSAASFVEFQDSWKCGVYSSCLTDYAASGPIVLHNNTGWTEKFHLDDVMSRGNNSLIKVKRTPENGGTNSLYGMTWNDVNHQFAVSNSKIISLTAVDESHGIKLYGAKLDFGGWFESGGGHAAIIVGNYCSFVESTINSRLDGYGGIINGTDMRVVKQSGSGIVDIKATYNNQQGVWADISSVASGGSVGGFAHALAMDNLYTTTGGRNVGRVAGAKFCWTMNITADKTITIQNLPCYSSFKATLWVKGSNAEFCRKYEIDTAGFNNLARVTALSSPDVTNSSSFKLQPFGGGSGGANSTSNGGKIDLVALAGTFGGGTNSYSVSLEIEMQ